MNARTALTCLYPFTPRSVSRCCSMISVIMLTISCEYVPAEENNKHPPPSFLSGSRKGLRPEPVLAIDHVFQCTE